MTWTIPLWTLAVAGASVLLCRGAMKMPVRWIAAILVIVALIPWLPSSHAELPRNPSTQIVYRFDDHRYLELTGYGCEGAVDYVDESKNIRTNIASQYWRLFLPKIIHADRDDGYIFIPYDDISGFSISKDGGLTFNEGRWVGGRTFGVEAIQSIVVVNRQAFIETKDGRLFMTSKPFGKGWGMLVVDPVNHLPNSRLKERSEFQDLPKEVPDVVDYKGWTQMRCDPDLEGPPKKTLGTWWNEFQQEVLAFLGNTVAWPAAWLARVIV